jgi:hypothetical protein
MKLASRKRGFKLIELIFSLALASAVGLMIYSIFYTDLILAAKNTAINTAHHQARVAMVNMLEDIHSAVSLPTLTDASGVAYSSPPSQAAGISFQKWASGPHKIVSDAAIGGTQITFLFNATGSPPAPAVGEHMIIPSHQIEADISAVTASGSNYIVTLTNIYGPSLVPVVIYPTTTLPVAIIGSSSSGGDIICFITDRCSYAVSNGTLNWNFRGRIGNSGNDIQNPTPFSIPLTAAGALYYRFVAAINLSTSDTSFNNRGFRSANILLNGQVPQKSRLTTFQ